MKFEANKEFKENLSLHCLQASATTFSHLVLFFMITILNLLRILDPI